MKFFLGLWLMHTVAARAVTLEDSAETLAIRDGRPHAPGETASHQTVYTMLSLICMMVLSLLLGTKASKLKRNIKSRRNIIPILILVLYIELFVFIIVSAVLIAGQGLVDYALCRAGTWVCLMFYTTIKAIIYVYLVERIHVVRAPFVRSRRKDKIYLGCLTMCIVMYGAVIINSYIENFTDMRPGEDRCYFGIRKIISIPFTVVNVFTDFVLTVVFFYLLQPIVSFGSLVPFTRALKTKKTGETPSAPPSGNLSSVQQSIKILLRRSIIGSILIEVPMAANMILFVMTKGEERGVLCLSLCLLDVVWDAIIIYWLTFGSTAVQAERDLFRSTLTNNQTGPARLEKRVDVAKVGEEKKGKTAIRVTFNAPEPAHVGGTHGGTQMSTRKDSAATLITPAPSRWPDGGV